MTKPDYRPSNETNWVTVSSTRGRLVRTRKSKGMVVTEPSVLTVEESKLVAHVYNQGIEQTLAINEAKELKKRAERQAKAAEAEAKRKESPEYKAKQEAQAKQEKARKEIVGKLRNAGIRNAKDLVNALGGL